ncbi:hypothetical protein BGZ65_000594 [Modicella reniformis]|uniref:Uncharacterized protein n=1 Tax=Modicella reniformis TaxID=1440133 RepID=A0A9P6MC32_9FUNG|nr:hypothetical protein BGZ65_000594 [Modicella reniformis]
MTATLQTQVFRANNSSIIYIRTQLDPKTGRDVVFWKDVQQVFKNASHIQHGTSVVSFMTDENFEALKPLRIEYHPGVVLDVILNDSDTASIASDNTLDVANVQEKSKPSLPDSELTGPGDSSSSTDAHWVKYALGVGALVGGVLAGPLIVTGAIAGLGFGAGGILAGTPAAAIMASYGGTVASGSLCAVLQSIGAAGLGATGTVIAGSVGGAVAAGGVVAAMDEVKKIKTVGHGPVVRSTAIIQKTCKLCILSSQKPSKANLVWIQYKSSYLITISIEVDGVSRSAQSFKKLYNNVEDIASRLRGVPDSCLRADLRECAQFSPGVLEDVTQNGASKYQ